MILLAGVLRGRLYPDTVYLKVINMIRFLDARGSSANIMLHWTSTIHNHANNYFYADVNALEIGQKVV